jgi:small subunit ribosomal protein S20
LANIKSQIKRNRQNTKRRLRNRQFRGAARAAVNEARTAFDTSAPNTKEAVMAAISSLERAAEKGVIHPNNASRRKGRLMKRLYALNAPAEKPRVEPQVEAEPATIEEPKGKKPAAKKAAEPKKTATAKKAAVKKTAAKSPAKKKTEKK